MEATASFLTSPAVSCSRSSSSSSSSPTCYFPSISHLRIPYSRSSISIRKTHLFTPLSLHPTSPASSSSLRASSFHVVHNSSTTVAHDNTTDVVMPKIDKSGRFCSPRAGRELALLITYASCLEGSDPIRLFEKRMNVRREPGYQFDKSSLLEYNPMIFGGPPVTTDSVEEADELLSRDNKESAIEAEVLSAPPKLVYSKLLLRQDEPASRILELCILHLAMSEITVIGTRHQIVINEAVDLAKRFCDGSAPRIINGCLRTFMKGLFEIDVPQASGADKDVL
ncbi:hypothetical protein LINPERPRIM_LOCUS22565 [Linum perenne]